MKVLFIINNQVGSMNEAADSVDKSGPPKYAPNHVIRRVNQGTSCMKKRLFSKALQAMLHLDLPGPHLNVCSHAIIIYTYYKYGMFKITRALIPDCLPVTFRMRLN